MQERNPELVDILRADFQHRNEPNFAWKSAASVLLGIPAVRGAWPMSAVGYQNPIATDISGNGFHLTDNDSGDFGYWNLAPYVELNGTSQWLSRVDGGAANWADITGTESYIIPALRGLTTGGWFWFDGLTGANQYCVSKGAANQNSYGIYRSNGRIGVGWVSLNGIAVVSATTGATTIADTGWHCIVLRFDPSVAVELFVDGTWYVNNIGVPASIFDGTAPFNIGAYNGTAWLDGRASECLLSAADAADAHVFSFYEQTRAMFGV